MSNASFTLSELGQRIDAKVVGDPAMVISGLATLQTASEGHLAFLANPAYSRFLASTKAAAVILTEADSKTFLGACLVHSNPYLAYAELSMLWSPFNKPSNAVAATYIDPAASIHDTAVIGAGAHISAGVVVESGVAIADGVRIGPNCCLGRDSVVGANTHLYAGVTLYHGVSIGADCILHSGVVIGSDGFGFAPSAEGWVKIAQLGGVIIEDNVEIGANTTIDRGALDNTVIRKGVILDNQIQVAHNVVIGENTAIAACSAIAGSTTIGKNCIVGGASGIAGHLNIVDGVHITAMTMVIKSLNEPGVYSSGTGVQPNAKWKKSIARLRQLDKMAARLKTLEQRVEHNTSGTQQDKLS